MIQITSAQMNSFPLLKTVAVLAIGFVVAGCARTNYVGYDKETASVPGVPLRTVAVQVDDAYFSDFPDCTIIMPTRTAAGLENFKPLVEEALGHHMTKKVSRVIGRTERNLRARQASLEVGRTEDRKGLAKATECKTLLYSRVVGQSFWSRPKDDYHNPVLSSPPAKKNPSALKRVASDSLFTHCVECLIR